MTRFLCKFLDEVEPEIASVDLLSILIFEFRLDLLFFMEVLLKIFQKVDKCPASVKIMILFRKILDLLRFVLEKRLMKKTPGKRLFLGNRRNLPRTETISGNRRDHRNENDILGSQIEPGQRQKK